MSNKRIKPEQLTETMMDLLAEYGDDVYKMVEEAAKDAARGATSDLRKQSPGKYARQWRHKAQKDGKTAYQETIYNLDYRLTHLLEKEHATGPKKRGHYPKRKGSRNDHTGIIARVEKKYNEEYFNTLVIKL